MITTIKTDTVIVVVVVVVVVIEAAAVRHRILSYLVVSIRGNKIYSRKAAKSAKVEEGLF